MKTKKFIIIGVLLVILSGILGYYGTMYVDKLRKGGDVVASVIFEDTTDFLLENTKKIDRETALKEWPYIFHLENKGDAKGLYQIKIIEFEENTIKKEDLSYILMMDEKIIQEGLLSDLKEKILYTGKIDANQKQDFKLYIWSNKDYEKDDIYKYKLDIKVIKTGGPGF